VDKNINVIEQTLDEREESSNTSCNDSETSQNESDVFSSEYL
jgi:hypothetical protein